MEVRFDAGPPVVGDAPREACAAVPLAVWVSHGEQAGSPPVGLDAGALGCDLVGRRLSEVAQHLPPDGRVTSSSQSMTSIAAMLGPAPTQVSALQ